jgi:hypothetical protein
MKELQTLTSPPDLVWIEQVLLYTIGNGKRKNKLLGGFVLSHNSVVRGAINKTVQSQNDVELKAIQKGMALANNNNTESKSEATYKMEQDVRQVDEERQRARTAVVHALVEKALVKKD